MHMEKELGVPKPGDLFIGVIDFFAVLVPGIIAAALIVVIAVGKPPQTDILFLSGLAIAGWVLGHVLHGIGSFLDPLVYDRLFKPQDTVDLEAASQDPAEKSKDPPTWIHRYLHKNDELYRLAKELTDVPEGKNRRANSDVPGGMYQWARTWLDSHSPESTATLDRLEADSKLFRSLVVLCLIAIPVLITSAIAKSGGWTHCRGASIVIAIVGALFSLWRYCDLRNKMIRRCYLYYVQRRFESRSN
jgi:hypothetical protein